jgi:hypothetical protein
MQRKRMQVRTASKELASTYDTLVETRAQMNARHESSKIRGGAVCLRRFLSAHAQSQQATPIA